MPFGSMTLVMARRNRLAIEGEFWIMFLRCRFDSIATRGTRSFFPCDAYAACHVSFWLWLEPDSHLGDDSCKRC
jgi:hypothetical protein